MADEKPVNVVQFSMKDGIKASGPAALIVAVVVAMGAVFYINNKSVVKQLGDIISRIELLVVKIEKLDL